MRLKRGKPGTSATVCGKTSKGQWRPGSTPFCLTAITALPRMRRRLESQVSNNSLLYSNRRRAAYVSSWSPSFLDRLNPSDPHRRRSYTGTFSTRAADARMRKSQIRDAGLPDRHDGDEAFSLRHARKPEPDIDHYVVNARAAKFDGGDG